MFPSNTILKEAIKIACHSDVQRGKIGAVLYSSRGHIIAKACNLTIMGSSIIRTIHAERALLNKAFKINAAERYGSDLNVLVIRWKPGVKQLANAKPCIDCHKALRSTSFRVYFTGISGEIEYLL